MMGESEESKQSHELYKEYINENQCKRGHLEIPEFGSAA